MQNSHTKQSLVNFPRAVLKHAHTLFLSKFPPISKPVTLMLSSVSLTLEFYTESQILSHIYHWSRLRD